MKSFLSLLLLFTVATNFTYSQCNCQKINRNDGTTVTQCNPSMIANDNSTQVGIAAASNGQQDFLTVTVRFKNSAEKITGDLSIRLENNDMISLELVNSQSAYIGNSEVSNGVYAINNSDKLKLRNSPIYTISLVMKDEVVRSYQATNNSDILVGQLKCI